jgi:23S rRNA pseudouridine1911/1915/1917 synthase
MGEVPLRILKADRGDGRQRLDLVVRRHLSDVGIATRTRVQRWISAGRVAVNGTIVRRASARAAFGDVVTVTLPDHAVRDAMTVEPLPLDILYEDDHLMAVNKPAGVVVHPGYRNTSHTLMNALLWHARDWTPPQRPSIVGRLDKLTSGVVIVAKTPAVHAALQRTMASGRAEKRYLAVVYGRAGRKGTIDLRLRRDPRDRRRVIASRTDGAPSVTTFERVDRTAELSLLQCWLITGRTHQIRVHLAASGWPLVGDPAYGQPRWTGVADSSLAAALRSFPRQALHAWQLALPHPFTGKPLQIEAEAPADFHNLLIASGLSTRYHTNARDEDATKW